MTVPFPYSSNREGPPLVSTATHQFAVWYDLTGELHVGRIQRGVHQWGVNHQEYTFAGAPRTAMALPHSGDEHEYPTIGVDGLGRLHVWANMHNTTLRAVKTTDPHTSDTWLATAGWSSAASDFPSIGVKCTYPMAVHHADGTLVFYIRDVGDAAQADAHYWTRGPTATTWSSATFLFQGLEVPGAGLPPPYPSANPGTNEAGDDNHNWSAYPSLWCVESPRHPHPGRLHLNWVWRRRQVQSAYDASGGPGNPGPGESAPAEVGRTQDYPAYGYSDDKGATWYSITGTQATLPFTPLNNLSFRIGLQDTSVGYLNGQGLTLDDDGLPHMLVSATPMWWMRRNATNTAWIQTTIANPMHGFTHTGPGAGHWFRGNLWLLSDGDPPGQRRPRMWNVTGTGTVVVGGEVNSFGAWTASIDLEAYRRFGTLEVLTPDGNTPRVLVVGNGARVRAA